MTKSRVQCKPKHLDCNGLGFNTLYIQLVSSEYYLLLGVEEINFQQNFNSFV